jgi:hypothetical protein
MDQIKLIFNVQLILPSSIVKDFTMWADVSYPRREYWLVSKPMASD